MCEIAVGRKFQLSLLYTVVISNYKTLPLISTYIFKLKNKEPVKLMLKHTVYWFWSKKFITACTLCNLFVLTMVILRTLDWDESTILWFVYSIWEILWGTLSSPWLILRMTVRWTQGNWPTPPTLTIINSFWTCTVIWCGPKSLALLATFQGLHLLLF